MRTRNGTQTVKQLSCCFALMLAVLITPLAGAQDTYALEFDVQDSEYVETSIPGLVDGLSEATLELWVYATPDMFDTNLHWRSVAGVTSGTGSSSGSDWTFGFHKEGGNREISMRVNGGGTRDAVDWTPYVNRWVHLAGVFEEGEIRTYVNGELATAIDSGQGDTLNADNNLLYLSTTSSGYSPGDRGFAGMLRDVRLWDRVRTETEIQDHMHGGIAGSEEGLLTYLPLDEGTGATVSDLTAFENHGTIVGAQWVSLTAVPDVLDGQESATVEDAEAAVESAGFTVGDPIAQFSDTVAEGLVIGVFPDVGEYVVTGGEVSLIVSAGASPRHVVPGGAGAEDGSSWGNAFASIQDALDDAAAAGADVWVAAGTYASSTLNWPGGVEAYGGFPVGGGDWADRDPWTHQTILTRGGSATMITMDEAGDHVLDGFTVTDTAGGFRGSVRITDGHVTIANCIFSNNENREGGAFGARDGSSFTIENTYFIDNETRERQGGAIWTEQDVTGTVTNCVFVNNYAVQDAGAIFTGSSATVDVSYSTFYGNSSDGSSGRGVLRLGSGSAVSDSIIWGNTPNTMEVPTETNLITDVDPLFADAEAGNLQLVAGSPAIEAGEAPWPSTDIRGTERPVGAAADIGAYEYVPPIYVTPTGSGAEDGSTWDDAYGVDQFQAALDEAGATGSPVWVAGGEYDPGDTLVWPSNAKAYGGFAIGDTLLNDRDVAGNETVLTGADTRRVIDLSDVSNTRIDGFTIASASADSGAGINVSNADDSNVIAHCTFVDNAASYRGGAIYMANASMPLVTDCVFTNNHADGDGGGIYLYFTNASPTIMNSVFIENTTDSDGGGIFIRDNCYPVVANCVFLNNAARRGAGIYNRGGDVDNRQQVSNSTFVNNDATERGGGYYCDGWPGGRGEIVNSIFWGNTAPDQGPQVRNESYVNVTYSLVQDGFPGAGNIDEDPLFIDVAAGNLRLQEDSPAIDAGDPAGVPPAPATDILGVARPYGAAVDMGAYEIEYTMAIVPDVVGMTEENAETAITDADLAVGSVTGAYSDDVDEGDVISQDPAAGAEIRPGSAVDFVVSLGPGGTVPDLMDEDDWTAEEDVQAALEAAGLALGEISYSYSGTVPAGFVMGQSIEAGEEVPAGSEVDVVISQGPLPAEEVYVVPGGAGDADGSSWEHALASIQEAVDVAVDAEVDVWVAAGTYVIDETITWPGGVAAYGGFPAEGGDWSDRNPWANATILEADGASHLIWMDDVGSTGNVLDGFTLTGVESSGRGALRISVDGENEGVEATIANCIFIDNMAGAAAAISVDEDGVATIENCYFINNQAETDAGAILFRHRSTASVTNSVFAGNESGDAWGGGGAIFTDGDLDINYCTFYGNVTDDGNAHTIFDGTWGSADINLSNSIFWGNTPNTTSGGVNFSANTITDQDPLFVDAAGNDLSLQEGSPAIETGDAPVPATDIRGIPRPQGAAADVGAYEFFVGEMVVVPELVIEGWTLEEVQAALEAAGLNVGTVTQVYSDDVPEGEVISQNPAAGSEIPEGSAVNLTISRGPAPDEMPLSGLAVLLTLLAVMAAALGSKTLLHRVK